MTIPAINVNIVEIEPGVFYAQFDNQKDLGHCLMRLQEYYEGVSDDIRGKYFTLEEFLHHFTADDGVFDYTHTWRGFNVPGHVVEEWFDLFANSDQGLTDKERQFTNRLLDAKKGSDKWYLIATRKGSDELAVVNHEIAHARYYLDDLYFTNCNRLITEIPRAEFDHMCESLTKMGYTDKVLLDEVQAYLSTSKKPELKHWFGKLSPETYNVVNKFRNLFKGKKV